MATFVKTKDGKLWLDKLPDVENGRNYPGILAVGASKACLCPYENGCGAASYVSCERIEYKECQQFWDHRKIRLFTDGYSMHPTTGCFHRENSSGGSPGALKASHWTTLSFIGTPATDTSTWTIWTDRNTSADNWFPGAWSSDYSRNSFTPSEPTVCGAITNSHYVYCPPTGNRAFGIASATPFAGRISFTFFDQYLVRDYADCSHEPHAELRFHFHVYAASGRTVHISTVNNTGDIYGNWNDQLTVSNGQHAYFTSGMTADKNATNWWNGGYISGFNGSYQLRKVMGFYIGIV